MKTKNIKVGDIYECIEEWHCFTKEKEYTVCFIDRSGMPEFINDINNVDGFYDMHTLNKHFRPVEQKYMCVMKEDNLKLYYDGIYNDFMIKKSDDFKIHTYLIRFQDEVINAGYKVITSEDFMKKFPPPSKEVEFVKGEKYVCEEDHLIIECIKNSDNDETTFEGMVFYGGSENYKGHEGHEDTTWQKSAFKKLIKG